MTRALGYPGVTGQRLPDAGAVNRTTIDGVPYLCVAYEVERRTVQPLRLAAALVAAPVIVHAGRVLARDPRHRALGQATQAVALGVGYWSAWVWMKAHTAMRDAP